MESTFRNNGIALFLDYNGNRGGNNGLSHNLFQSNDTAILFRRIPDHLTLTWFEFYSNRFIGNQTDVDNRTGMYLPTEDNDFLDENGVPKN